MENRPLNRYPSRLARAALLLVIGANVLVWSFLALSAAYTYDLSFKVYGAPVPVATSTFAPTVPLTPLPNPASSTPPTNDGTMVSAPTTTLPPTPAWERTGVPLLPVSEDNLVVALLGTDAGRTSSVWRTDTIILVFIQQEVKRAGLLSLPRDLWVFIPDHGYGRINTVDVLGEQTQPSGGGCVLLDKTLRHNLGVSVDHYVRIDLHGFVRVIDAVGGVTVNVEKPVADIFPDPSSPAGVFKIDLPEGPQHMDGRTTLAYCRSRAATSDFDRSRRQQKVLMALWKQALTPEALTQAPQLWTTFRGVFETDLTKVEAIRLAHLVYGIEPYNVRSKRLDATAVTSWTTQEGAQVLLPQTDAIRRVILELLSLPE